MVFTFKTTKATGRYRSFHPDVHDIKYNKKVCGQIIDKVPYKIGFTVTKKDIMENKNPNCPWKWIYLKTPAFENVKEAKNWVKERTDRILEFFDKNGTPLHLLD